MAHFPRAAESDEEGDDGDNRIPVRDLSRVWEQLAADLPPESVEWRQDGKPSARDGKYFARFVCYVEAGTIRERLDSVIPGEWDLKLELLPSREIVGENGRLLETAIEESYAFKARLEVLGVAREDVGTGSSYKQAATDAFKRASVRFGIGHELYDMPQLWVEVDGDGKYAKPVEAPQAVYARKYGKNAKGADFGRPGRDNGEPPSAAERSGYTGDQAGQPVDDVDSVSCPKCGGRMWDNRQTKRNPKAPDYKCRDRNCDGVVWPEKHAEQTDALEGQGHAHGAAPTQGGVSTTRTIPATPVAEKKLPGETDADLAADARAPRQVPGRTKPQPRSTPPSQQSQQFEALPAALQDEDDDLPF